MKRIILSLALFMGVTVAVNAQDNSAGAVAPQKVKVVIVKAAADTANAAGGTVVPTVVDQFGTNAGKSGAVDSTTVVVKKPVKKSCCKKHGESNPCNNTGTTKPKSSATKQD